MSTRNAGKDEENPSLSCIAAGTKNGTPLWKMVWHFVKKKKTLNTHLTYKATTTLLGIYPEEMENLSSRKNLLANVCSNWICYNRNLGTIKMSRDGRTVRRTVVPPCHGKLLSEEEEQTTDM